MPCEETGIIAVSVSIARAPAKPSGIRAEIGDPHDGVSNVSHDDSKRVCILGALGIPNRQADNISSWVLIHMARRLQIILGRTCSITEIPKILIDVITVKAVRIRR